MYFAASTLRCPEVNASTSPPSVPFGPPLTDKLLYAIAATAQLLFGPVEKALYDTQRNLSSDNNSELRAKIVILSIITRSIEIARSFWLIFMPFDTRSSTYVITDAEINAQLARAFIDDAPIETTLQSSLSRTRSETPTASSGD